MNDQLRILAIGAHPDDCDIAAGGVAALWAQKGHQVRFVSVTDGGAGHHAIGGIELVQRRTAEAQAAAKVAGIEYWVLDDHDGELEVTLASRKRIVGLIRTFAPDLILTHRLNDYHPDHRNTAQLVQDAAYMVTVPNHLPTVPHLPRDPVIMYFADSFSRPYPFQPDVVVDIDDVFEVKMDMLHCHTSQVYEWLPYNAGVLDQVPTGDAERRAWLEQRYGARSLALADRFRAQLTDAYGKDHGRRVRHSEAFEVSEYGAPLTPAGCERLFPF